MGKALEVIGWLIMIATMLAVVIVASNVRAGGAIIFLLPWAVPGVIGGLIIAAFGRTLTEVIEAKGLAQQQVWLLEEIAKSTRMPVEPVSRREETR